MQRGITDKSLGEGFNSSFAATVMSIEQQLLNSVKFITEEWECLSLEQGGI